MTNMIRSVVRCLLLNILLVQSRTDDFDYELDFVHSFLVKSDKLGKTKRLDSAEDRWIKKTGYKVVFTLVNHKIMNSVCAGCCWYICG